MSANMETAVLCYVRGPWAYFTTQPLDKQWGDDWNDAPYEHNAGRPYESIDVLGTDAWVIFKVAYDGPFDEPSATHFNSPYSVQDINRGAVAWLRYVGTRPHPARSIQAGTTYADFRRLIREGGGAVFEERQG